MTSVLSAGLLFSSCNCKQLFDVRISVIRLKMRQRFQAAMKYLQPIASMLASQPPAKFEKALQWLELLDNQCRTGLWEDHVASDVQQSLPEPDDDVVADVSSTDADICDDTEDDDVPHTAPESCTSELQDCVEPSAVTNMPALPADIHLPQPVRRVGRPAKQRKRLFAKKAVSLERLTTAERDRWRLEQLASPDAALAAVRQLSVCEDADLLASVNICLVTEERFGFAELKKFFSVSAWDTLSGMINQALLGEPEWQCSLCNTNEDVSGKWVQCDRCLSWLHYSCLGISRKPRGHFFLCTV